MRNSGNSLGPFVITLVVAGAGWVLFWFNAAFIIGAGLGILIGVLASLYHRRIYDWQNRVRYDRKVYSAKNIILGMSIMAIAAGVTHNFGLSKVLGTSGESFIAGVIAHGFGSFFLYLLIQELRHPLPRIASPILKLPRRQKVDHVSALGALIATYPRRFWSIVVTGLIASSVGLIASIVGVILFKPINNWILLSFAGIIIFAAGLLKIRHGLHQRQKTIEVYEHGLIVNQRATSTIVLWQHIVAVGLDQATHPSKNVYDLWLPTDEFIIFDNTIEHHNELGRMVLDRCGIPEQAAIIRKV